ncbi:MAG: radical SAM protein [Opitutaceae bacterium]
MPDRPYLFLELTNSLCSRCLQKVEAKILQQDGRIFLQKHCPQHGFERVLVSDDPDYWRLQRRFLKPGQMPRQFHTALERGCPFDCGLCPDHEQHSCLAIVEVCDACNLACPVCYADSSPARQAYRSLEEIELMLERVVASEGEPDIVQISGGEPTIHPEFFAILDAARRLPIKHLMLNTNGVRIAREDGFAERLASYAPRFEIYLQFDSLEAGPLRTLRGLDLRDVRRKALERLNALNLSTTLVVTLQRGLNDGEIGRIIDFALEQRCVRGVTFQPVQAVGRVQNHDPARDRITLSEVRRGILEQTSVFAPADIVPVPCHPDCLAMAYALKFGGRVVPLTSMVPHEVLLQAEGSTIIFEQQPELRRRLFELFSTSHSPESGADSLRQLDTYNLFFRPGLAAALPENHPLFAASHG